MCIHIDYAKIHGTQSIELGLELRLKADLDLHQLLVQFLLLLLVALVQLLEYLPR